MITIVNPHSSRSLLISPVNSAVSIGFIPATGSSNNNKRGCVAIARAISSLRLFAYDNAKAGWSKR